MTGKLKKQKFRRSSGGFTLIEVLIAMVIFAGAIVVLSSSWSGSLARVRKSNLHNDVSLLLKQKVTELEIEFRELGFDEIDESGAGDFGKENPKYRWSFSTKELILPDLTSSLIARDEGADQILITMIQQLTEYVEQVVKELTVTVYAKSGKREVPFSITTYLVDYEKNVPLGGGL